MDECRLVCEILGNGDDVSNNLLRTQHRLCPRNRRLSFGFLAVSVQDWGALSCQLRVPLVQGRDRGEVQDEIRRFITPTRDDVASNASKGSDVQLKTRFEA